ncbi:MAG: CoA transferase [Rhodospirillaceae bacterium]|nr:CoA transferase [Rhodospirillaceae bacterium]
MDPQSNEPQGETETTPGPLEGVRIIDLTSILFGPIATQFLANMGAEVIKVEAPDGDVMRYVQPMRSPGMGAVFMNSNRAKQSVALNLKTEAGRQALNRLVETGDVFVHSMRSQAAAKLGIDYDSLKAIKPNLLYCFACGYDSQGPNADLPAYDDIIQAATGLASITTLADGTPQLVRSVMADKISALYLTQALLAAIMTQKTTGQGQYVEVPMFECLTHFMMIEHMFGRCFEPPMASAGYTRVLSANRQTYRTKDSYIAALPYTTAQWQRFLALIGKDDLAREDWVNDATQRSIRIDELYGVIAEAAPSRTTDEWVTELRRIDIPVSPVNSLEDLFSDPQLQASGLFEEYEHPTEGHLRGTRHPIRSAIPPLAAANAPHLGEHTRAVLASLGYGADEIDNMISAGAATGADMDSGTP